MTALQYVWLYDEKGNQPINPFFLSTLDHLVNDPYRSLAWMARRQGAYNKDVVSYQELIWANFFRDNVPFNSSTTPYTVDPVNWNWCQAAPYSYYECDVNEAVALANMAPIALALAKSAAAKSLLGNGTVDPIDCTKGIDFE